MHKYLSEFEFRPDLTTDYAYTGLDPEMLPPGGGGH